MQTPKGTGRVSQKFQMPIGSLITDNLDPDVEIKSRIEIAPSTLCANRAPIL